jgi:hypothetical protein
MTFPPAGKLLKVTEFTPVAGFFATQLDPQAIDGVVGPVGLVLMGVYVAAYLFQVFNKKLVVAGNGDGKLVRATIATEVYAIREDVKEIRKEIRDVKKVAGLTIDRITRMEARLERHAEIIEQNSKDAFREINRIRTEGLSAAISDVLRRTEEKEK